MARRETCAGDRGQAVCARGRRSGARARRGGSAGREARSATRARLKVLRSRVVFRGCLRSAQQRGKSRSQIGGGARRAPVRERVLEGVELPWAAGASARPSSAKRLGCPRELGSASSQVRLCSGGRAHGAPPTGGPRPGRSRGRQVPTATRGTVGPGSRARQCVDRHTDRLQEADERAVMLARVAHPACCQDRVRSSRGAPIRSTCGTRSRAARSARATLGRAGGGTDPSPRSTGRSPRPGRRPRPARPCASARILLRASPVRPAGHSRPAR